MTSLDVSPRHRNAAVTSPRIAPPHSVTPSRLRIAQVAPLYERVPPRQYGGTERIVSYLCDELARRGHDVTLFATADSETDAHLCGVTPHPVRNAELPEEQMAAHVLEMARVFERAHEFDIIHCHVDFQAFPFARLTRTPTVHTLHGRLDVPYARPLYNHFRDLPFVSISDSQREAVRDLKLSWAGTVYHGLPLDEYPAGDGRGGYLAFLGRVSPEKRPDLAIEVAQRAGLPLKIAAKLEGAQREYFERAVKPALNDPRVEFVGEIGGVDRTRFLGDALALVFPIDWPEPFGLVMIEALACGTPVVAFRRGSVPEVIANGRTGFIVDSVDQMVEAVTAVHRIDRAACRREVEERFTDRRMTTAYETVYANVLEHARTR